MYVSSSGSQSVVLRLAAAAAAAAPESLLDTQMLGPHQRPTHRDSGSGTQQFVSLTLQAILTLAQV